MWHAVIMKDLSKLPSALTYYDKELLEAEKEVVLKGNIQIAAGSLPGHLALRYRQFYELDAIASHIETLVASARSKKIRYFMEAYNREMKIGEAIKWIDGEEEIVQLTSLLNEIILMRNKFGAINKGLDSLGWQISNIIKLEIAGIGEVVAL